MDSTMQDFPLTVTAILRYASGVHGDRTVSTATRGGHRQSTYRDVGRGAARLANALRGVGITGDERVATFMWNNAEHLTAYLAVPAMGAVLHTLNIRLSPEQIAYIANEAEDRVVLVDLSLAAQLAAVLPQMTTVHTVIAVGQGDLQPLCAAGKTVLRYHELTGAEAPEFDWPRIDENSAAAMCYTSGTTGNPKGVVYSHRSTYLHSMAVGTANGMGIGADDSVLAIVPMFHANAWGLPYGTLMAGADLVLPDRFLDAKSLIDLRRPDHLERRDELPGEHSGSRHLLAAPGGVRWISGAAVADEDFRETPRRSDPPTLGDDRDIAAGDHGVARPRNPRRSALGAAVHPGPPGVRCRDPNRRRRGRSAAHRRRGGRRARGPRTMGHRRLLPRTR
jgi:fatty-acyl-CoA synthase